MVKFELLEETIILKHITKVESERQMYLVRLINHTRREKLATNTVTYNLGKMEEEGLLKSQMKKNELHFSITEKGKRVLEENQVRLQGLIEEKKEEMTNMISLVWRMVGVRDER